MSRFVELLATTIIALSWLAGIVLAKGAISTIAAIFIPPYAWYLVVERAMFMAGVA